MKLHTKQIIAGLTLFIMGAVIIPIMLCILGFVYFSKMKPLATFTIPGQAVVTIEKSGRHYLWNDYQTIFENTTYSSSPDFPGGLEISLLEKQTGHPVNFIPDQSISVSSSNHQKNSIGYFNIDESSTYILSVLGTDPPRVCSFGKSVFNLKIIIIFLGCFALTMTNALLGLILVIMGIVTYNKSKKQESIVPETVEVPETTEPTETNS